MSHPNWLNENRNRAFPFLHGTVNLQPSATLGVIPNDVVADAGFLIGPGGRFDHGTDKVFLARVRRDSDIFYFDFETDAPEMVGVILTFVRPIAAERYVTSYADSYGDAQPILQDDFFPLLWGDDEDDILIWSGGEEFSACDRPLWSGYLITGDLSFLIDLLPDNGEMVERDVSELIIEPALIQSIAGAFVKSINLANEDRTRVDAAQDCAVIVWPFETGVIFQGPRCLTGTILLMPGFNASLRQDSFNQVITLTAAAGGGEGQPCEEVEVTNDESLVDGLLSGGPSCDEVLRSINGTGGRILRILAGTGVEMTQDPETNTLSFFVSMLGMATCPDSFVAISEFI